MNVLFLGYETEACAMAVLSQRLQEEGHAARVVLCDNYNFIDDTHIHDFLTDIGFENWVNYEDEYAALHGTDDWTVDWEFLSEFEDEYCSSKNLQQLLMTDPLLCRHHHFRRPYMTPITDPDRPYYWAERLIRWIQRILDEFDPDIVFTIGRNYFVKNVVAQIAESTTLPMRTLLQSRIGDNCLLVDNFGHGTPEDLQRYLESEPPSGTDEAEQIIRQFENSDDEVGLYEAPAQEKLQQDRLYYPLSVLRDTLGRYRNHIRRALTGNKAKFRGRFRGNHFNSHTPSVLRFLARIAWGRIRYEYGDWFQEEIPERPFIYFPLHTLPESSVLTLSDEYFEDDLVRFMAKEVPADTLIAVKENPNMLGIRWTDFYDELRDIPNARLIDPSVPSKRLIRESIGVCGISGTALLEAAALGKPTHCFGQPDFETVVGYKGHAEFESFARDCKRGTGPRNPERIVRFFQYAIDEGEELPFWAIRDDPDSDEFYRGLDSLEELVREEMATLDGTSHASVSTPGDPSGG